jgi:PX domain
MNSSFTSTKLEKPSELASLSNKATPVDNLIHFFGKLLIPPSPPLSEDTCSVSSFESEEEVKKQLTEFPRFESGSIPRPVRRPSVFDASSYAINRKGSISNPDAIPIQYYRLGTYAGIESAITQNRITKYALRIVYVKVGTTSREVTSLRRYCQIRKLYTKLLEQYPLEMRDAPSFPRKEILGRWNDEIIRTRTVQLDYLFKFLVLHPTLIASGLVQEFFQEQA